LIKSSQAKVISIGRVYMKKRTSHKWIPIIKARLIERGKKKGWYEVTIPNGHKSKVRAGQVKFDEVQ